jgi:hypothetical protein
MTGKSGKTTAVLGASDNPERYAFKAMQRLMENKHPVIPVNPNLTAIIGVPVRAGLSDIEEAVDTVTVYLAAARSTPLADQLIALKPKRVIFNPGAENPELERRLDAAGIPWLHACTLVLLATGQY